MTMERVFNARSVAVIGASKDETKRGYQTIRTLVDEKYEGEIYPVNPREAHILGLTCYKSVLDIDGPVDLALIATPARTLPSILETCGEKGIAGAVILAGGFGEMGPEGKKLEKEMVAVAGRHNIRLIGPNTSGMMNLKTHMNLVGMKDAPKGDIALLTQSGNMALTLITEARLKSHKGFTYYVGVGNESDIRFHEYLEFFRNDPDTRSILMYVEGMRNGREFLGQAYKTTRDKPVVLLKSGRSTTGKRSAGSHTGALAGNFQVAKGAFERAGITVIENSDELFPTADALASMPPVKKNKIAILADGGGHATLASDALTDLGVELPLLSEETRERLKKILPAAASVPNPVDVAGGTDQDPTVFADCTRIILEDENVGGLLIVGLFGGYGIRFAESLGVLEEKAAREMIDMVGTYQKPVILHSLFAPMNPEPLNILKKGGIPVHESLDIACKCVGVLAGYGGYLEAPPVQPDFTLKRGKWANAAGKGFIATAKKEGRNALLEYEAKALLGSRGVSILKEGFAETADQAAEIAAGMDGPVALKLVSPDILHKSDAGGVKLKLGAGEAVRAAFTDIMESAKQYDANADLRGVLVSPMAATGVEIIIGTKMDDQFGPIMMFGMGGIMVEILKDVVFRVIPVTDTDAGEMVEEIRSAPLLRGVRGTKPADIKAIRDLLVKVSEIIESYPEIEEMDLNPVIVHSSGLSIVDARIILKP